MIKRLRKITDGLYRGSAPAPKDVIKLHKLYGVNKIISLDQETGDRIDNICKLLGINHIMLPLDGSLDSLINLFQHNIKDLLLKDGPTFYHCLCGKDRTGLLSAVFKIKYMGMDCKSAIKEAKSLGFGIDVDPVLINLFEKLIVASCKTNHKHYMKIDKDDVNNINQPDIVSNERSYIGDYKDSPYEEEHPSSFAPYLDTTRQWPFEQVSNYSYDQYPTRQNYDLDDIDPNKETNEDVVPIVGAYDGAASGLSGAGPIENGGGFVNY